jgi:hypothetical protein
MPGTNANATGGNSTSNFTSNGNPTAFGNGKPNWQADDEKWLTQAQDMARVFAGGLVLLVPIVGFVVWWCVKKKGSREVAWTRELREKEAGVRREVEGKREERKVQEKALKRQKKREKKEKERLKARQEKEREKAIKRMVGLKELGHDESSLSTEGEESKKDAPVFG